MKIIITESQLKLIQKELDEDYPSSWNIEEFKKLTSFKKRVQYCNQHLQRISSGSSRIVYKIDEEKVLKLAKNRKGLAQNETEISHSNYYDISDITARVFENDPNNLWVEMELARKMTPSIFEKVVGVKWEDYIKALKYHNNQVKWGGPNNFKSLIKEPENFEQMWDNEFVYDMLNFLGSYEPPVGDLCAPSTYGVVKRNGVDKIVMIDYGLTEEIFNTYYKRK